MNISIIVLAYNQEKYIQECLESIKYQIAVYNPNNIHNVQVIVSDDASRDQTKYMVEQWLDINTNVFDDFVYIVHSKNVGTCQNYLQAIQKCTGDYIKAIGGDDIFPRKSIFDIFSFLDKYDIVYGNPLVYTVDSENNPEDMTYVYRRSHWANVEEAKIPYYNRIHRYCFFNAPSTYISKELLTHPKVQEFLATYKFIDDYPQWLKFSELKDVQTKYINDITIIYRRTNNSAYKVRNKIFENERIRIYEYALSTCKEWKGKVILKSIIRNMKNKNSKLIRYLNIHSYLQKWYWIKNKRKNIEGTVQIITENLQHFEHNKLMVEQMNNSQQL